METEGRVLKKNIVLLREFKKKDAPLYLLTKQIQKALQTFVS